MKQGFFALILAMAVLNVSASDLTAEQVVQQIQLSHMLGQISQEEQNYRIRKVRALGVDGYYEWLQSDSRGQGSTVANGSK